jgi:cell division septation protein DedD
MSTTISQPKKKTTAKRKTFLFELSRKQVILWLSAAFLALAWMFTLGIIVGRGLSPVSFDTKKLSKDFVALKKEFLKKEERRKQAAEVPPDKMQFDFYDVLADKKEEALAQSSAKTQEGLAEPSTRHESPSEPQSKDGKKGPEKEDQGQHAVLSSTGQEARQTSFTVQVASLTDSVKAKELVSSLKDRGFKAYTVTVQVPDKGTYHRVRVGHFKDRHQAKQIVAKLRRDALEPIIIRE